MLRKGDVACDGAAGCCGVHCRGDVTCLTIAAAAERRRLLLEARAGRAAARQVEGEVVWQVLIRASKSFGGEEGAAAAYWLRLQEPEECSGSAFADDAKIRSKAMARSSSRGGQSGDVCDMVMSTGECVGVVQKRWRWTLVRRRRRKRRRRRMLHLRHWQTTSTFKPKHTEIGFCSSREAPAPLAVQTCSLGCAGRHDLLYLDKAFVAAQQHPKLFAFQHRHLFA